MPGGGRLGGGGGGGGGGGAAACRSGGGGGGALATTGGGGGFDGSIGLHMSTLCLRSSCSAASSILSFFSLACSSSSDAFSTGVGSGGGSGAGGAGVSIVATLSEGSTGAQARSSHEAISSRIRNISPNSRAPQKRDQPTAAGSIIAGALASTADGGGGGGTTAGTDVGAKPA